MTTLNSRWPDAKSVRELLDELHRTRAAKTNWSEIALVVDLEDRGVRVVSDLNYDEEHRLLVLEF